MNTPTKQTLKNDSTSIVIDLNTFKKKYGLPAIAADDYNLDTEARIGGIVVIQPESPLAEFFKNQIPNVRDLFQTQQTKRKLPPQPIITANNYNKEHTSNVIPFCLPQKPLRQLESKLESQSPKPNRPSQTIFTADDYNKELPSNVIPIYKRQTQLYSPLNYIGLTRQTSILYYRRFIPKLPPIYYTPQRTTFNPYTNK